VQKAQQSIPVVNRSLPPKIDAFGKEVKRNPAGIAALQPFAGGAENPDPVRKELMRLKVFITPPSRKARTGNTSVELTQEQHVGLQRVVGAAKEERATRIVNSAYYKSMSDERRADRLNDELRKAGLNAKKRYLRSIGVKAGR
jgi:hypothetical protein